MKVDRRILIGLGVVVVGIIVYIIIKNSNKDDDDDDKNDDKEDNTKTNKARLDRLEKALTNAGIDTLEDFGESVQAMTSTQEETGFTKSELFNIINQYFPTSLCVVEKLLDDGLMNDNNKIRTHYQLVENHEGKVEKRESEYILGSNMYLANFDQNLLTRGLLISSFIMSSLIFALENDNLDNWYSTFIGIMSMMSLREEDSMFASYDEDHEDPYSTLVLYWQMGDGTSKNPEDYIEAGWIYDRPTNADGSMVQYIKFTPKIQFDRNKEKIEDLKQFIVMVFYDYMVKCNSE